MTQAPPLKPTEKQWEAIRAIKSGTYRYILTGGAISTAKSYGLALVFLSMARQFPRTRYGIFRRNLSVIRRTIYQTFKKVAFDLGFREGIDYTVNKSEWMWEFANGSQIWFVEADETKDPDWNKIKGLELTAAGVDEANEIAETAFDIISSRVGRENRNNEPQFVLLTCNPSDNWVKQRFYTPWTKDSLEPPYLFIPSLPQDNPHNSAEYLRALNEMPVQFRKRYVEGNWDYVDDSNALFPNHVIDRALVEHIPEGGVVYAAADVAREGADSNVFGAARGIPQTLYDLKVPDIEIGDEVPILNQVTEEFIAYMKHHGAGYQDSTVDAVGLGAGVVDNARKMGFYVKSFKAGERATQLHADGTPKFDNLRSERYWLLSQAMQSGDFKIWKGTPHLEDLRRDLLAHSYEVTDKQFIVISKSKMKKKLGRSPDFSDAVSMAFRPKAQHNDYEVETAGDYSDWFPEE